MDVGTSRVLRQALPEEMASKPRHTEERGSQVGIWKQSILDIAAPGRGTKALVQKRTRKGRLAGEQVLLRQGCSDRWLHFLIQITISLRLYPQLYCHPYTPTGSSQVAIQIHPQDKWQRGLQNKSAPCASAQFPRVACHTQYLSDPTPSAS